jgi:hypothetical protein
MNERVRQPDDAATGPPEAAPGHEGLDAAIRGRFPQKRPGEDAAAVVVVVAVAVAAASVGGGGAAAASREPPLFPPDLVAHHEVGEPAVAHQRGQHAHDL